MFKTYPDNYIFPAIIEKGHNNYSVYFYDLPGCAASGDTVQEAVQEAKAGLELHLWGMEQDAEVIPVPTALDDIKAEPNESICYIEVNMFPIRAKMDNRPVKKTLTIPWYLNALAERQRINFSQLLQNALKERLGV